MASIKKISNEYRVRFVVYRPDGYKLDRSRRKKTLREAKELKLDADLLEAKTQREGYTEKEIEYWIRINLLSKKDAAQLVTYQDGRKTLKEAAEEYRKTWGEISHDEIVAREGRVARIVEILGADKAISDIRHLDGEHLKTLLRTPGAKVMPKGCEKPPAKLKAVTVNKHIQDLKRMFKLQVAQRSIEFHPFAMLAGVPIPKKEKIAHKVLTMDEIVGVISSAEEMDRKKRPPLGGNLTLFLLVFFGCGIRRKEAIEAKLENIDWDKRTLLLIDTKSDVERTVGLGQRLFDLLLPRKGQSGAILPKFHKKAISAAIMRHFKKCGLDGMRLHDTRHTFTTQLLDMGVSKRHAKTRTGHADARMLDHYDHPKVHEIYEDDFEFMMLDNKNKET